MKNEIKNKELIELPDYDVEKFPSAMRRIIEEQGEEKFLERLGGLIKKHARINVNLESGDINLTIAGLVVINENFRGK